ncbi:MAG: hypothetical protein ACOY3P_03530 [Planctomycetota bacterium]
MSKMDLLALAGVLCTVVGLGMAWLPLGVLAAGAWCLVVVVVAGRQGRNKP